MVWFRRFSAGFALLALPLLAQEPQPASLDLSRVNHGVDLTYAWRVAPGDDPARAQAGYDDSAWETTAPFEAPKRPVSWYRRHLKIAPNLQGQRVIIRIQAPGAMEVFVDGELATASYAERGMGSATATVTFAAPTSVLAVRHRCAGCSQGFAVRVQSQWTEAGRLRNALLATALATVPAVLALIHLGLWFFARRARENLFLALCLASFAGIVAFSAGSEMSDTYPWMAGLARFITASIISAEFFALMTYYEIQRRPLPRSWIGFAVVGAGLALLTTMTVRSDIGTLAWTLYFAATLVEIARLEIRERTRPETGVRPLVAGLIVLLVAIVLQVLAVSGVIPDSFPWGRSYYFGLIALAIGSSVFTVTGFATTRRKLERNEGEIASARKLQEAMLPTALPSVAGLELGAFLTTASDVGGDYYDFREAPDGALLVAIGDAAGHGLAAGAMVTAMKALFSSVEGDEDLPEILRRCDAVLRRMDVRLLHMCLAFARFRDGSLEFCSAAMPPPLIHRRESGKVEELGEGGLPLGGALRGQWESVRAALSPGDTVLFASDGLGELLDPAGDPFGFDAVAAAFARAAGRPPDEVIACVRAEAAAWRGKAEQADDITIVVARVV